MPATSAASLALAARLRDLDDDRVGRVIRERSIAPSSLRDVFDLAEALLDPVAIGLALASLTRTSLIALATAAQHDEGATLDEVAARLDREPERVALDLTPATDALLADLADARVTVWPAVSAELAAWPARGLPGLDELRSAPALPDPPALDSAARLTLDRTAAESAFTTTMAVTEVVLALGDVPGRLLARGGLALPDAKRLAAAAGREPDEVGALVDLASLAGLVDELDGTCRATDAGDAWRRLSPTDRWARLADAWRDSLPHDVVALLADQVDADWGSALTTATTWLYPASSEAMRERLHRRGLQAERLGIAVGGRASSVGRALLTGTSASAASALAPLVPAEVEQVYLQHDLTIVSPGPLKGALDERLRRVAEVESSSLAGRYRITAESVTRAIALGETAQSLSTFLATISLTGVPQPLSYLIDETARRYGAVRVGTLQHDEAAELGARTGVRSDDPVLLEAMLVDGAAAPLALRRVGPFRLVSRHDAAVVLWTLIDARYPAASDEGTATPERPGRARTRPTAPAVDTTVAAAVERIRSGSTVGIDGDGAWVARQWELALRGKLSVRATVTLPDGTERSFDLEPTGIAAGRVRGRDKAADIERTLPVASITALEPLE
jgi:hypothetical protein